MADALVLGRYTLHRELASGGMATVYIGRLNGPIGFGRTVAIKRLHPHYAKEVAFVKMFMDEARLAARIQHPNVVPTLDVVAEGGELFLVLDFVNGESLSGLARAMSARSERMPPAVLASIIVGALRGLDAAHEARDERGEPLAIVHRDVSPQNIMVGADGVPRLCDFGVAKARARLVTTQDGHLKGKIAYMAPEQLSGDATRRSDIYGVGVVLWEMLAGRRLFSADNEMQMMALVARSEISPPSAFADGVPSELDRIVQRALARSPEDRYASAYEMARDIDRSVETASPMRVAEWMTDVAGSVIDARAKLVAEVESGLSRPPAAATLDPLTPREAATQVIATASVVAKVADKTVRDAATKLAGALKLKPLGAFDLAKKVRKAAAPLVEEPTKKSERPRSDDDDES